MMVGVHMVVGDKLDNVLEQMHTGLVGGGMGLHSVHVTYLHGSSSYSL